MVYMAETAALAVLEVRVHLDIDWDLLSEDYVLLQVDTSDAGVEELDAIPDDPAVFGDTWLRSRRSALLRVPSVIVPESANILLNPEHPEARSVDILGMRPFRFDRRLWAIT